MTSKYFIKQLQDRGLISQVTDAKGLETRLAQGPITLYCGFDPTMDSLHVGHLMPLLCLKRFQLAGHTPIALLGGGTGLIGDPSFKATERKLQTTEIVHQWLENIQKQIARFLDFHHVSNNAIVVNNYHWFSHMNVLTFLRDIGKHFSVSQMINKESVKQRLKRNNFGISFTEFSYNLLQGFDFSELYRRYQVELQIGGSDQWGNITSGIALTRRIHQKQVFGLTMPLITKSDGIKFGKTENGTLWLSAKKTSPYKFYQFWINTADADVYRFLKLFTFLSLKEIHAIEAMDKHNNQAPSAQHILAKEITTIVHGTEGLAAAIHITESLFSGKLHEMTEADFAQLKKDGIPTIQFSKDLDLQQALINAKLVPSRSQARTMIISNAVSINGKKNSNAKYMFNETDRFFGRYTLLCRGKKHYCLIDWK
ncbi:tyrosine--tRNA ligase [Candidatus Gillettellia adelgis]